MKTLTSAVAVATLALAATLAFAQGTPGYGPGMGPGQGMGPGGGYGPGRGSADRGEGRERMRAAHQACQGKPDQRACMTEQVCAKSSDPAQCQARAKERAKFAQQRLEQRQKLHEACNGKRGDELSACMQTQHLALRNQRIEERQKAHEACSGKRGDELSKCLGDQRQKSGFGWHGPRG
ncbi:MAG: hypothetical protein WAO95_17635 [Burkholderiales bacterium]